MLTVKLGEWHEAVLHPYERVHMQSAVTHQFQAVMMGPYQTVCCETLGIAHLKRLRRSCGSFTRRAGIG